MKKNLLLLIFIATPWIYLSGQTSKIDALKKDLSKQKEDTNKVNTLNELVNAFRDSNTDSSLYYANEELSLASKLNYQLGIADSKLIISALFASQGKFTEGVKYGNDALTIYNKLLASSAASGKEKLLSKIGRIYLILGHNNISRGDYPEGLKNTLQALKIKEQLEDSEGISTTEFNLGNIYSLQKNYSEALMHYYASIKISKELGQELATAGTYSAIGWLYIQQGNYMEALKNCSSALKLAEAARDSEALAEIYNNLGLIYNHDRNYSEALKYDLAALALYEKLGIDQQLPDIYNNIGLVYLKQKKYKDASDYFNKALGYARKIGSLELMKWSYENWAELDSSQGNFKNSLEHYKLAITVRDSLYNRENTKKMVQQQMQYDFDKKESGAKADQERKDAIALKELQKQKLVRNGFVGGFAVVLLFAGVFFTQRNKIRIGKQRSDELLLNILPSEVAEELKAKGSAEAKQFNDVTVMFTDFKNFTQISEKLSPTELVNEIHTCFKAFDDIIGKHNIEKIKTIGDAYMCAGGLPVANTTNATDVVSAAMEIQHFMQQHLQQRKNEGKEPFEIRIGIHTGPVVAGIVGIKKFAYDIWGDTVNIASRMESSGEAGKVNISGSTYELVKDKFSCIHRGKIQAKNKGEIDMYFVESIS